MDTHELIIAILATWRLSAMLSYERGIFDFALNLREWLGIIHDDDGKKITIATPDSWRLWKVRLFFAKLLDCVWCVSVWIGGAVAIGLFFYPVLFWLLLPFALSAGAILIERLAHGD